MLIYCKHGRIGKNQVDVLEDIQIEEENKITSEFCKNVTTKETETEINKNEREKYDGKLFQKEKAKEEQKLKQIKPTLSTSKDICTSFIKSNLQSSANQELKFNQSSEHKEDDNYGCQTDNQLSFFHGSSMECDQNGGKLHLKTKVAKLKQFPDQTKLSCTGLNNNIFIW